ncbi:MAG: D-glycero-beta-D-manno-heptose 1,7-bisphosphate 7-phosphatase [Armatimonadetes bacterium]|nr:D-glycero-beta-D-manno-heptose 1,7-bisphosphate 7-phosphatase [Armatimonadota bacterium]
MKVVFLDRDGVINKNRDDYVKTVDEFEFLPGALEGLARLKEAGYKAVIVSNQAGVGRGLFSLDELEQITKAMLGEIRLTGGEIAGVYYCIHRKDEGCGCRKPEPGLFLKAREELGLDSEGGFLIGDTESDICAGYRAGCTTILVLTGKSSADDVEHWQYKPDYIADNLNSAVEWIINNQVGVTSN